MAGERTLRGGVVQNYEQNNTFQDRLKAAMSPLGPFRPRTAGNCGSLSTVLVMASDQTPYTAGYANLFINLKRDIKAARPELVLGGGTYSQRIAKPLIDSSVHGIYVETIVHTIMDWAVTCALPSDESKPDYKFRTVDKATICIRCNGE